MSHSLLGQSSMMGDSLDGSTSMSLLSPTKPAPAMMKPSPSTSTPTPPRRRKPNKLKPDLKLKCGACGNVSLNRQALHVKKYPGWIQIKKKKTEVCLYCWDLGHFQGKIIFRGGYANLPYCILRTMVKKKKLFPSQNSQSFYFFKMCNSRVPLMKHDKRVLKITFSSVELHEIPSSICNLTWMMAKSLLGCVAQLFSYK